MEPIKYNIRPALSDDETAALGGTLLQEDAYNLLIDHDADVYDQQTGRCIAKFRKRIIPIGIAEVAFENLKSAAKKLDNRGMAAGWDEKKVMELVKAEGGTGYVREPGSLRFRVITKDGKISNTLRATPAESGVIGYFDRNPRHPYCRQTAFNEHEFKKFKKGYPVIKAVDKLYSELMPEHYALQRAEADRTSPDFVIKDTAFTTVTVNRNWQTAVHTDKGDFEQGFGNLVALRRGIFTGGYFVLPKWKVAFDLKNQDILLADVHQWHGNTPIKKVTADATRISLVMYYRKNMVHCESAVAELERAKSRTSGNKLNG